MPEEKQAKRLNDLLDDLQDELQEIQQRIEWVQKDIEQVVITLLDLSQELPDDILIELEES